MSAQEPGSVTPTDGIPTRQRRAPQSPSRRLPHKNWYSNAADMIERQMQATGYDVWGYVIYRTAYSNDAEWEEFLRRLRYTMERSFDRCNGRDILDLFSLTVFSDPAQFDGADSHAIRAHFREWSEQAEQSEQLPPNRRMARPDRDGGLSSWAPPSRYQFCIQVDEESLHAVVHDAPAPPKPDPTNKGWVKLINKNWIALQDDPRRRPGWEAQCTYPPIEGVTERDVGWMKVRYGSVMMVHYHGGLTGAGANGWMAGYCRPPDVV